MQLKHYFQHLTQDQCDMLEGSQVMLHDVPPGDPTEDEYPSQQGTLQDAEYMMPELEGVPRVVGDWTGDNWCIDLRLSRTGISFDFDPPWDALESSESDSSDPVVPPEDITAKARQDERNTIMEALGAHGETEATEADICGLVRDYEKRARESGVKKGVESVLKNAVIKSATLLQENGHLTSWIALDYGGHGKSFGGRSLGEGAGAWIKGVLKVAGVSQWENLPGRPVRVIGGAFNKEVEGIAHFLKDDVRFVAEEWREKHFPSCE